MPPQSRGGDLKPPVHPTGLQSRSTPNLPTLKSLKTQGSTPHPKRITTISPDDSATSADNITSPSEPASIEDFSLEPAQEPVQLPSPGISEDGEDDLSEEEDGPVDSLPALGRSMSQHQHSRSHTYLAPLAFAPPFYNRPPTPLPPSPSLTSLLRPTFSSQNSRPTTPDPSSDEGAGAGAPQTRDITGTQTPNSATASTLANTLRSAKPVPRASPKVPTYEYYGFALYFMSGVSFIVYLLWAFLPSPFLHSVGIYYYPNRWWALAIPAWTVMLMVYMYVALASYNVGYLTLSLKNVECFVDAAANVAVVDANGKLVRGDRASWRAASPDRAKHLGKKAANSGARGKHSRQNSLTKSSTAPELDWRYLWNEGTDAVMDIPVGGVCEVLYGGRHDGGGHDEDDEFMYD